VRRVAITGLGLVTPLGVGVDAFWTGLVERRSGVSRAGGLAVEGFPTTFVGQMPEVDFDAHLGAQRSALWSRASKLAVYGGMLAAEDAAGAPLAGPRCGVVLGTGYGCTYDMESYYDTWFKHGWRRLKPASIPKLMPNAPASQLGVHFGARGFQCTVATACSSGAVATGLAVEKIRAGRLDACLTGGLDYVLNASTLGAWCALRVLSRREDETASRPFSVDRDGLVPAEGCAILVLEEWEAARARGARIRAEVVGVGATNDAVNIVGPDLEGEVEAMRMALADAAVAPDAIDWILAHGTATPANDANETRAIKEVFGPRARELPVSSIKGHIGHTMGAAGAIEAAAAALALEHQTIPPTLHFTGGDPDCDLDYVGDGPRRLALSRVMTNSFGFGGQNSVLVLSRP